MAKKDEIDSGKIMDMIKKAGSEEYETIWNEKGVPISKKKSEVKKGKKSRAAGGRFELIVRKDLEEKGKIVDKWSNNIDLEKNEMIIAKRKFNPFSRVMTIGTGFPDFLAIQHVHDEMYSVIGVEVKLNGLLSKEEKEKCAWYLKHKTFSKIWIARAEKKGNKTEVMYDDFAERYGEKFL